MPSRDEKLFLPNIAICVLMDLLGMAGSAIPFLGIVIAPLSGYIFLKLFDGRLGLIGGVLNFIEELLPFADLIPSFTIAWFIRKKMIEKRSAAILRKAQR